MGTPSCPGRSSSRSPLTRRRVLGAGARGLALGLALGLSACSVDFSGAGPWKPRSFGASGHNGADSKRLDYTWAKFGDRGARLIRVQRTNRGAVERQVIVCYLPAEGDRGEWDDGGSSSKNDGATIQWTQHLQYLGSDAGMNHEQDLGYRATWSGKTLTAPFDSEEVLIGGRGLPITADTFVVVRATHPSTLLTCEIDPSWPGLTADTAGFLDSVCASQAEIGEALSPQR